ISRPAPSITSHLESTLTTRRSIAERDSSVRRSRVTVLKSLPAFTTRTGTFNTSSTTLPTTLLAEIPRLLACNDSHHRSPVGPSTTDQLTHRWRGSRTIVTNRWCHF